MPGRRGQADPAKAHLCRRCQENEPAVTVRTEPLCRNCFINYIHTKVVKRVGGYKFAVCHSTAQRTFLLPLSLGASSLTLLHILDGYLKGQIERTGRTGFALHVLHIDTSSASPHAPTDPGSLLSKIQDRYPAHTYSSIPLSDILSDPSVADLISAYLSSAPPTTPTSTLTTLLSALPSPTSRADVLQALQTKLLISFAVRHNLSAVLLGHSTTTLAERVLAETAKGRGGSLPFVVADGEGNAEGNGGVPFYYPMRDLLRKEIVAHAALAVPPLTGLCVAGTGTGTGKEREREVPVSMKNSTIDGLMVQYFEGVEREYPSIVANVVRTAGKLVGEGAGEKAVRCALCGMVVALGEDLHGQGVVEGEGEEGTGRLCHGCKRSLPKAV
ncbi:Cytoplasmic tRNA 2-thiolation protein 2 [Zalaria obscura]|uniref:Cytoplasmic tRNA 2-thiolation protein 2 n=1 Tax=Zalaria obscura TaxID=2024903 RepID=A0ACC3SP61_9PEZI